MSDIASITITIILFLIFQEIDEHETVPAKCLMAKLQNFIRTIWNQLSQVKITENFSTDTKNSANIIQYIVTLKSFILSDQF